MHLPVPPDREAAPTGRLIRPTSHRLTCPDESALSVVAFIDFASTSCKTMHPVLQRLCRDFADRVTFVARYFPAAGHPIAQLAARVAETAAAQGKFGAMCHVLFTTQPEWRDADLASPDVFRPYAQCLGLDIAHFEAMLTTPAVFVSGRRIPLPGNEEAFAAILRERLPRCPPITFLVAPQRGARPPGPA